MTSANLEACAVCGVIYDPQALFCRYCGNARPTRDSSAGGGSMHPYDRQISRVRPTPANPVAALLPIDASRRLCIREVGDCLKAQEMIAAQSEAVCQWLGSRQGQSGISIRQDVRVKGWLLKRSIRASIVIKTW